MTARQGVLADAALGAFGGALAFALLGFVGGYLFAPGDRWAGVLAVGLARLGLLGGPLVGAIAWPLVQRLRRRARRRRRAGTAPGPARDRRSGLAAAPARPSLVAKDPSPMMYPPELLVPMREELTSVGFQELTTPEQVDDWVADKASGVLVINSVCGCAAGMARPGVRAAIQHANKPARLATVFAGQDREATQRARGHFEHIPPSSPSIALFKDGEVVDFLPRHRIEGRTAEQVRDDLTAMFDQHFGA